MKSFNKTINIIYSYFGSEFITCFSTLAIITSVAIITQNRITWDFLLIIILSALAVYFFDFFDDKRDYNFTKTETKIIRKEFPLLEIITALLLISALMISLFWGNLYKFSILLAMMTLGICYPFFFKKITGYILGFKDFYVAILWNLMVIYFFIYYSLPLSPLILILLLLIFTRDLMGAIFCDYKDRESDRKNGLKTFAVLLNKADFFLLLTILNVCSLIILMMGVILELLPLFSLILLLPITITSILIFVADKYKNYSELFIDYEYFLWLILLFVVK